MSTNNSDARERARGTLQKMLGASDEHVAAVKAKFGDHAIGAHLSGFMLGLAFAAAPRSEGDGERYLIRKGGYYYRPNAQGYTVSKAEAGRYTLEDAIRLTYPNGPDGPCDGLSYHLDAPTPQPARASGGEREDLTDRFWLILREPGCVPDRKGPWKHIETAKVLREFMAANPTAFIDHLTIGDDGTPHVEHGPLVLQYTDGRSMSVGRKHNERVRAAALAALAALTPDAGQATHIAEHLTIANAVPVGQGVEEEREACAKIAAEQAAWECEQAAKPGVGKKAAASHLGAAQACEMVEAAIRARSPAAGNAGGDPST